MMVWNSVAPWACFLNGCRRIKVILNENEKEASVVVFFQDGEEIQIASYVNDKPNENSKEICKRLARRLIDALKNGEENFDMSRHQDEVARELEKERICKTLVVPTK